MGSVWTTAQTIKANCGGRNKVGGGIKGKKKVTVFQNSKTHASSYPHRDQCDLYSEKEKENIGVEFISNINGKIKTDTLTLDSYMSNVETVGSGIQYHQRLEKWTVKF